MEGRVCNEIQQTHKCNIQKLPIIYIQNMNKSEKVLTYTFTLISALGTTIHREGTLLPKCDRRGCHPVHDVVTVAATILNVLRSNDS